MNYEILHKHNYKKGMLENYSDADLGGDCCGYVKLAVTLTVSVSCHGKTPQSNHEKDAVVKINTC